MKAIIFIFLFLFTVMAGCDLLEPSDFETEIVVSGFLVAGEGLPSITVRRTLPVGDTYDAEEAAVANALVRLQLLEADGSAAEEYAYEYSQGRAGIYWPEPDTFVIGDTNSTASVIRPLHEYKLIVEVPGFDEISSTTLVPDTFSVHAVSNDTVTFQSEAPFTFTVTPPEYPGRQSVFVFNTIALDGFEEQLTPFARSLLEDGDDLTIADLRERVSPILNEENFEAQPEGMLRIQFPWLAVYFYGRNRVSIQALDDNLYDFIRSRSVQQGGSTRPPGEIPNIIDHVEGGRGVFGSYAKASTDFFVIPPEE